MTQKFSEFKVNFEAVKKKKILILAYDFPPYNSIGAQRPYSWIKFLPNLGYEPIVITRHWDNITNSDDYYRPSSCQTTTEEILEGVRIIRTPFKPNLRDKLILKKSKLFIILRKVLSLIYNIGQYHSFRFDNRSNLYQAAEDISKNEKIDLIIASAEPYVLFRYGYLLNKKHNIPWVADYRDEWTTDSIHLSNKGLQLQFKFFLKSRELKFMKNADLIISAANNYSQRLNLFLNQEVKTIYNGYFKDDFKSLNKELTPTNFEISYIGSLYDYQPLEEFLEGVKQFTNKHQPKNFKLVFYGGSFDQQQEKRITKYDTQLSEYIVSTDRIPRDILYQKLNNQSSAFLILASSEEVRIPGKLFDYMGLGKSILLFKDDENILKEIVSDIENGIICNTPSQVAVAIEKLYFSKKSITHNQNSIAFTKYTREQQAIELANLLNNLF